MYDLMYYLYHHVDKFQHEIIILKFIPKCNVSIVLYVLLLLKLPL